MPTYYLGIKFGKNPPEESYRTRTLASTSIGKAIERKENGHYIVEFSCREYLMSYYNGIVANLPSTTARNIIKFYFVVGSYKGASSELKEYLRKFIYEYFFRMSAQAMANNPDALYVNNLGYFETMDFFSPVFISFLYYFLYEFGSRNMNKVSYEDVINIILGSNFNSFTYQREQQFFTAFYAFLIHKGCLHYVYEGQREEGNGPGSFISYNIGKYFHTFLDFVVLFESANRFLTGNFSPTKDVRLMADFAHYRQEKLKEKGAVNTDYYTISDTTLISDDEEEEEYDEDYDEDVDEDY